MNYSLTKVWSEKPLIQTSAFWAVAAFIFIFPLFIFTPAKDTFIIPKWTFLNGAFWFMLAAAIAASIRDAPITIPLIPSVGFGLLFALWQTSSLLWSSAPALTIEDLKYLLLAIGAATLVLSALCQDRRRLLTATWVLIATSILLSIWVLSLDFLFAFSPGNVPVRSTLGDWRDAISLAGFGNSGHVADFIALSFLATLAVFLTAIESGPRWVAGGALWLQAAALIVAWSFHTNLSLIVAALIMLFLLRHQLSEPWFKRRLRLLLPLAVGWVLIVLFYVVDHPANPHGSAVWGERTGQVDASGGIFSEAFSSQRWKDGGPTRMVIWLTTLEAISENPWLGTGYGTFTYTYPSVVSEIVRSNEKYAKYAGSWTNDAHNSILHAWAESGIVGAALILLIVGSAFVAISKRLETASFGTTLVLATTAAMLTALCLQAQMNFPLQLPVSLTFFFVLVGIPGIIPQRGSMEQNLLMPATRPYPLVRLGIMIENMKRPIELHFSLNLPKQFALPTLGVCLAIACLFTWAGSERLRASVAYRSVYEFQRMPPPYAPPNEVIIQEARKVLEIDPTYVDVRSGLSDVLMRNQRFEEVLEESEIVLERLNATEVYLRMAVALEGLQRVEEAKPYWAEVFRRQPVYAQSFPGQYNEWLSSLKSPDTNSSP